MMEGVVNVLKPPGMTSSDVVSELRHIFNLRRVGHTGTLDPAAAGVLPICLGRATRLFDYLVDKQKRYIAEIAFGLSTDTQDAGGKPLAASDALVSRAMLLSVLPRFTGEIRQIAPMYSAVRVEGRKLYQLARAGEEVPQKWRDVCIHTLELIREIAPNHFLLCISCTKGTYVRTICHDIGDTLGIPAHMAFLLRTHSGSFDLDGAYTLDELRNKKKDGMLAEAVIPIERAIAHVPALCLKNLSTSAQKHLSNGAPFSMQAEDGKYRLYVEDEFWGIGVVRSGQLHIELNMILEPGRM